MLFLDRIRSITVVGQRTFNNLTKRWIKQILTVPLTYLDVMIFFFSFYHHFGQISGDTMLSLMSYTLWPEQRLQCFVLVIYCWIGRTLCVFSTFIPTKISQGADKNLQQTCQQDIANRCTFQSWMKTPFLFFCMGSDRKLYFIEFLSTPCPIPAHLFIYTVNRLATRMSLSEMNLSYNFSEVGEIIWRMAPLQLDFKTLFYFAQMPTDFFWKFS